MDQLYNVYDDPCGGLYKPRENDDQENERISASIIALDEVCVGKSNDIDYLSDLCERRYGFIPDAYWLGKKYQSSITNQDEYEKFRCAVVFIKY